MRSSIDDIEGWDWKVKAVFWKTSNTSDVLVQRDFKERAGSTCDREGYSKNRISTELLLTPAPLVLSGVQFLDHEVI